MGHNRKFGPGVYVLIFLGSFMVVEVKNVSPCNFSAIYNFGDSNSATSAESLVITDSHAGKSSEAHSRKAKRKSRNFRLIVDFIAAKLGHPYLRAYMVTNETNFKHGANFAVPGAIIRQGNNSKYPYFHSQTVQFLRFKFRTIRRERKERKERTKKNFSKALYTIDIGENDVARSMYGSNIQEIPDMLHQFATGIQTLYKEGARAFWIHNTGPIGCLVSLQKLRPPYMSGQLNKYGCLKSYNAVASDFNKQLKGKVVKLRKDLNEAAITYVDVYTAKYNLFRNAQNLGFKDPLKICKTANVTCKDPSKYVLWDGIHYTETANRLIAKSILDGSYSNPPVAITHACYKNVTM